MFLLASSIIGVSYGTIAGNEYMFLEQTVVIFFMLLLGGVLAYLFGRRYGKKSAVTFFVIRVMRIVSVMSILKVTGLAVMSYFGIMYILGVPKKEDLIMMKDVIIKRGVNVQTN